MDIEHLGEARLTERVKGKITGKTIDAIVTGLQEWRRPCVPMLGDDVPGPTILYNAAGAIYPTMNGEQQQRLASAALASMDRIRYDMVQENHSNFIAEPLFLADIANTRHVYWPGLDAAKNYVSEHGTFASFERKRIKDGLLDTPYSDFCVAYGLMRSDFCNWGSKITKALRPSFIERVVKGTVLLRSRLRGEGHARLRELLPKETYAQLEQEYAR